MSDTISFPRQDILEAEKNQDWCKKNVDYAVDVFRRQYDKRCKKIDRHYNAYNGVVDANRTKYLTHTYSSERNLGNFVDYRLGRTKVDLLEGEWLKLPFGVTVETVNRDAKSKKLDLIYYQKGLQAAGNEVNKLREIVGVDVLNGMEPPKEGVKLNTKTMNEKLMQLSLDYQIKKKDLKTDFSYNWKDTLINSGCFGKIDMDSEGKISLKRIDFRDAIFIESENDPFMKNGPVWGHREKMFTHDIIKRWGSKLTQAQRDKIEDTKGNIDDYRTSTGFKYADYVNKELVIDVYFVEWKSLEATKTKISPDKNNPNNEPFKKDFSPEYYKKNEKKIQSDVKKGKYKVETTWKEVIWEGVLIGDDIYVDCKKQSFQIQTRGDGIKYRALPSYTGLLFNTVDGIRVSLVELMDNLSFLYNVVMFQINRELAKLKGKVIAYDQAGLPKNKSIKQVMYNLANDGIYLYNSAQDGNRFSKNVNINGQIKEIDLGISQSFQQLVNVKVNLEDTLDRLSGINENRQGQIAASSTATNAISAINASQSITAPIFYFFNKYTEIVLTKIAEKTKLSWTYLNPDEGSRVLGDDAIGFFELTKDFAYDDYSVFLGDGRKDNEVRQKIEIAAQASLNSKELRIQDYAEYLLADTTGEAIEVLSNGWNTVKEVQSKDAKLRNDAMQQQLQTQLEMNREDREDKQAHELEKITLEKTMDIQNKTQEAKNQLILEEKPEDEEGGVA